MLVISIDTTLETGVVPMQYQRIQRIQRIQRWIDVGPNVNFCLGKKKTFFDYSKKKRIWKCINVQPDLQARNRAFFGHVLKKTVF